MGEFPKSYSNSGFVKFYIDKTAISAINSLKAKALLTHRQFNILFIRILTDNGKEYTARWADSKHKHKKLLNENHIKYTKIKPRTSQSNGTAEIFNRSLLE